VPPGAGCLVTWLDPALPTRAEAAKTRISRNHRHRGLRRGRSTRATAVVVATDPVPERKRDHRKTEGILSCYRPRSSLETPLFFMSAGRARCDDIRPRLPSWSHGGVIGVHPAERIRGAGAGETGRGRAEPVTRTPGPVRRNRSGSMHYRGGKEPTGPR